MTGWHKTPQDRARDNKTYGPTWRKARKQQLEHDNHRCQLNYPNICLGRATTVDHIDGAANDPHHQRLRSACEPCHRHRTATEQGNAAASRQPDPAPTPRTQW
jgi:5-methylcytosine-specific restriction enzyme A